MVTAKKLTNIFVLKYIKHMGRVIKPRKHQHETFSAALFSAPRSCWIPWVCEAIFSVREISQFSQIQGMEIFTVTKYQRPRLTPPCPRVLIVHANSNFSGNLFLKFCCSVTQLQNTLFFSIIYLSPVIYHSFSILPVTSRT